MKIWGNKKAQWGKSSEPGGLLLDPARLPQHIAVIMDGNGRWAKARTLPRTAGHHKGAEAARSLVESCIRLNIPYLTLYAFSAENWQRPVEEVSELMRLLEYYLDSETRKLHENGIRLRVIGDRARLSPGIRDRIIEAEQLTEANNRLHVTMALSYGGRQELVQAAQRLARLAVDGVIQPENISPQDIGAALYDSALPDPDLLIRTGGDQRVSNFLLWQIAYAELYFTETLWPDFNAEAFEQALQEYQRRERRFGRTASLESQAEPQEQMARVAGVYAE